MSKDFPQPDSSLLLDIPSAASFLGLTPWQIRGLVYNHELPRVMVGRKIYLRRAALTRWADRAEGKHKI
jgi:excisionase family DNA binding protein